MNFQKKIEMEHTKEAIRAVMGFDYTKEEAVNILDGKNADGSEFIELPF